MPVLDEVQVHPLAAGRGASFEGGQVGVLGTVGTVVSESYPMELEKWSGGRIVSTVQEACPMWVPIVENNEIGSAGADYFIKKNIDNILDKDRELDTIILGCTHYPLLKNVIQTKIGKRVELIDSSICISEGIKHFLDNNRDIERQLGQNGNMSLYVSDVTDQFKKIAQLTLKTSITFECVKI